MDPIACGTAIADEDLKSLVCRGCLSASRPLRPMGSALANLYDELVGNIGPQADAYPQWVCSYCHALLLKFSKFRDKCRSSQDIFFRLYSIGIPMDLLKSDAAGVPYPDLEYTPVQHINLESNLSESENVEMEDDYEEDTFQDLIRFTIKTEGNDKLDLISNDCIDIKMPQELVDHSDYTNISLNDYEYNRNVPYFFSKEDSCDISNVLQEIEVETCNEVENEVEYGFNSDNFKTEYKIENEVDNCFDSDNFKVEYSEDVYVLDRLTGIFQKVSTKHFKNDLVTIPSNTKPKIKRKKKETKVEPKIHMRPIVLPNSISNDNYVEIKTEGTEQNVLNDGILKNDYYDDNVKVLTEAIDMIVHNNYNNDNSDMYSANTTTQLQSNTYFDSYANYVNKTGLQKVTTVPQKMENPMETELAVSSLRGYRLKLKKEKQGDSPNSSKQLRHQKRSDFRKNKTLYLKDEGPLICELCGATKKSKLNLIKHMNVHTKPYKCSTCEQRFAISTSLKKHLIRRHNIHPAPLKGRPRGRPKLANIPREWHCQYCQKIFSIRCNRDRHEDQVHRSLRPSSCKICGSSYSDKSALQMHINTKHLGLPWPKRERAKRRQVAMATRQQGRA